MSALWTSRPKARIHHTCDCCGRTINPGEQYRRTRGIDDDGEPYNVKQCAHCIDFVALYIEEFAYDWHEGYTVDEIEEWEPTAPEAIEHKRRWSIGWRHGRDLYPLPMTVAAS